MFLNLVDLFNFHVHEYPSAPGQHPMMLALIVDMKEEVALIFMLIYIHDPHFPFTLLSLSFDQMKALLDSQQLLEYMLVGCNRTKIT
jgi:hypothetical protein